MNEKLFSLALIMYVSCDILNYVAIVFAYIMVVKAFVCMFQQYNVTLLKDCYIHGWYNINKAIYSKQVTEAFYLNVRM